METKDRRRGQTIVIDGHSVSISSPEEFVSILYAFEAAVSDGEIDNQLEGSTPAGASLTARELEKPSQRAQRADAGVPRA